MDMNKLKIRQAKPSDCEVIEALWRRVISQAFKVEHLDEHIHPDRELEFKMNQLDEAFQHTSSRSFLAFVNDTLVGTIAYGNPPNRGILKHTGTDLIDTVELGSLYIDPSQQKKGYGRLLLIFALEDLRDKNVETVCFDSIYETSKRIWRRLFGEPKYKRKSTKHNFVHMVWVVDVKSAIERLKQTKH